MSQTLWQQLQKQGLVSGDEPVVENDNSPWYVRTMLAIAGWFGALFLLGAVFSVIGLWLESAFTAGVLGLVSCLVAVLIYRMPKLNDFMAQFAFAISLVGQSLLVFSILSELEAFEGRDSLSERFHLLSIVTVFLQTLLFFMISNYLHRTWSALLVAVSLMYLMNIYGFYPFTLSILLAAGIALWLQEFNWVTLGNKLTAPAYALVFVSLFLLCCDIFYGSQPYFLRDIFGVKEMPSVMTQKLFHLSQGGVLVGLVLVLLRRLGTSWFTGAGIAAILLSVLVAGIGLYVPGLTIGIALVLIGFSHSNRVLTGLGLVTVVVFVFQFYYLLDLTLLEKSGLLVVSGLILLLVRYLMSNLWPIEGSKHA